MPDLRDLQCELRQLADKLRRDSDSLAAAVEILEIWQNSEEYVIRVIELQERVSKWLAYYHNKVGKIIPVVSKEVPV